MINDTYGVVEREHGEILPTDSLYLVKASGADFDEASQSNAEARSLCEDAQRSKFLNLDPVNVMEKIIASWRSRCRTQHYDGEKRIELQMEFFVGAMCAMSTIGFHDGDAISPKIYFSLMRGDDILADSITHRDTGGQSKETAKST